MPAYFCSPMRNSIGSVTGRFNYCSQCGAYYDPLLSGHLCQVQQHKFNVEWPAPLTEERVREIVREVLKEKEGKQS